MKPTRDQRLSGARAIRDTMRAQHPQITKLDFEQLSADERHRLEEQAEACIIAGVGDEVTRLKEWLHKIDELFAVRKPSPLELQGQRMTHAALAGLPVPEEVTRVTQD